jgi:hypothetical protein
LANWRQDEGRDHCSDGSVKEPKDRGQGSNRRQSMTVLGILWDLIDHTCISEAVGILTSAALRQSSVGIRLCFIHESDVGHIRLLHQEWVQVQGMAAAHRCVSKNQKEPWRMEGTVRSIGERTWVGRQVGDDACQK